MRKSERIRFWAWLWHGFEQQIRKLSHVNLSTLFDDYEDEGCFGFILAVIATIVVFFILVSGLGWLVIFPCLATVTSGILLICHAEYRCRFEDC